MMITQVKMRIKATLVISILTRTMITLKQLMRINQLQHHI